MNGYRYLNYTDRKLLENLYLKGERPQDIADAVDVHVATIYKELKRGYTGELDRNGRKEYSAELAQRCLVQNIKRRGRKTVGSQQETVEAVAQ